MNHFAKQWSNLIQESVGPKPRHDWPWYPPRNVHPHQSSARTITAQSCHKSKKILKTILCSQFLLLAFMIYSTCLCHKKNSQLSALTQHLWQNKRPCRAVPRAVPSIVPGPEASNLRQSHQNEGIASQTRPPFPTAMDGCCPLGIGDDNPSSSLSCATKSSWVLVTTRKRRKDS